MRHIKNGMGGCKKHCVLSSLNYSKEVKDFLHWTSERKVFQAAGRPWTEARTFGNAWSVWTTMASGMTKGNLKQIYYQKRSEHLSRLSTIIHNRLPLKCTSTSMFKLSPKHSLVSNENAPFTSVLKLPSFKIT